MPKFKITVLKRMAHQDLVDEHCTPGINLPCPVFLEGQEFSIEDGRKPEEFCGSAWDDIYKVCVALANWGNFGGWMKETDRIVACCSDGLRPVVFEVRRVEA